jgi:hypothetical protein
VIQAGRVAKMHWFEKQEEFSPQVDSFQFISAFYVMEEL